MNKLIKLNSSSLKLIFWNSCKTDKLAALIKQSCPKIHQIYNTKAIDLQIATMFSIYFYEILLANQNLKKSLELISIIDSPVCKSKNPDYKNSFKIYIGRTEKPVKKVSWFKKIFRQIQSFFKTPFKTQRA